MRTFTTLLAAALIAMPVSLLAACAPDTSTLPAPSVESTSHALTLPDGWAKAGELGGMTGVFGTLSNSTDSDIFITGVESPNAGMIELHEVTTDGVMQPIAGDVVVPANGSFELAPGANHIMLMDLTKDLLAGDEVTFTLQLESVDGKKFSADFTVLVKDYAGANENYASGDHESESHDSH